MSEDSHASDNLTWTCPRPGCGKFYAAYSKRGLDRLIEEHTYQHIRQDREAVKQAQGNKETKPAAIQVFKPRDYNTLVVTPTDIGFLKTRGIKIDENIVIDREIK